MVQGEALGTGICHGPVCQRRMGSVVAPLAAFAPLDEPRTCVDTSRMHHSLPGDPD